MAAASAENLAIGQPSTTAAEGEPLPALFWETIPADERNPDLAAINSIIEESSPDERAEVFKIKGNEALQRGVQLRKRFYYRQAIDAYTEGLALDGVSAAVRSTLVSNRAQVQLSIGNNRSALADSNAAVNLNPENIKACYRGARAALGLHEYQQAIDFCRTGLALNTQAAEFSKILQEAEQKAVDKEKRERAQREAAAAARKPAQALARTLLQRGWRIGLPQLRIGHKKPHLDAEGAVHWPVMFIYPEAMQNDSIEDFHEGHAFRDHLDVMFGPEAPPLVWDREGHYTRRRLDLYYLSNAVKPLALDQLTEVLYGGWPDGVEEAGPQRYGPDATEWVRVDEDATLGEVLSQSGHIVPGIPAFFVLAKGTDFREKILSGDVPLL